MEDEVLGQLTILENELSCELHASTQRIPTTISLEGGSVEDGVAAGRKLAMVIEGLLARALHELVLSFLPLINGGYLEEGEAPLLPQDICRRATLAGVTLGVAAEDVTFTFADDDMLWGHWMSVHTDLKGSAWDSSMWG